ncbi:hypothetical protein [Ruegeria sp.]|uniref:hypothetical protein n=1 Tax=Ruegeria sp. TaxID=1879320 RepID=UPI003B5AEC9C
MDWSHKNRTADTESPGRELNEFEPREFDDLPAERPMDSGDATGAPPPKRYKRELAFQAWQYLERHDPMVPLPHWIANYLRDVATAIIGDLGPRGSLSPASAHAALAIVGEQWPEHNPESVFAIINAWLDSDGPDGPKVDGRKAGAVRYIKKYMGNDPNVQVATVIEWYRKGQKSHKKALEKERTNGGLHREQENLADFEQAVAGNNTTCEELKLVEFDHAVSGEATNTDVKSMTALDQAIANKDWQA